MAQHIRADRLHVLRCHVAAAVHESAGARGEREGDGRARARAVADHAVELELVGGGLARREDHIDDVILHAVVDVDRVHELPRADDFPRLEDALHVEHRLARRHEVENFALLRFARIADPELEHEAVELRLGKLVGALLFERVLRREHQEWIGELVSRVADRDLPLLHRLEQRALHLRRSAIDFIREDEVGEKRALLRGEFASARIVNERADEIGGEQVGRELDSLEAGVDATRERLDRQRLREAGHAFEEDVPVREQADDQAIDEIPLADDDAGDLVLQGFDPLAGVFDLLGEFRGAGHGAG